MYYFELISDYTKDELIDEYKSNLFDVKNISLNPEDKCKLNNILNPVKQQNNQIEKISKDWIYIINIQLNQLIRNYQN